MSKSRHEQLMMRLVAACMSSSNGSWHLLFKLFQNFPHGGEVHLNVLHQLIQRKGDIAILFYQAITLNLGTIGRMQTVYPLRHHLLVLDLEGQLSCDFFHLLRREEQASSNCCALKLTKGCLQGYYSALHVNNHFLEIPIDLVEELLLVLLQPGHSGLDICTCNLHLCRRCTCSWSRRHRWLSRTFLTARGSVVLLRSKATILYDLRELTNSVLQVLVFHIWQVRGISLNELSESLPKPHR
mmetsp:Transcript_45232/g.104892  ORF Transcript_45232/g.104892 Transcript_45232/m.104892 type:complete len:241 (+) Transcript_45232:1205-1927(+)